MVKRWQNSTRWGWVAVLGLTVMIASVLWYFGPDWLDAWKAEQVETQLKELHLNPITAASVQVTVNAPVPTYTPDARKTEGNTQSVASAAASLSAPTPLPSIPPIQDDFMKLHERNPQIIGWLTCGERIDYPVVQGDNDYYLHHDYFGKKDKNGTIFLNANNTLWPRDDVLLIHGHNMRSGKMFGSLHNYRDESYMREHPIIVFRTIYDEQDACYIPVAMFGASMNRGSRGYFDITQIVFHDDSELDGQLQEQQAPHSKRQSAEYRAYLDDILRISLWESPADVNVDDALLMLVTCGSNYENGRLMLVCRKLREGENIDAMLELFLPTNDMAGN